MSGSRRTLAFQAFAAIVVVAMGATAAVGVFTTIAFRRAFAAYRDMLPMMGAGMGMGRARVFAVANAAFSTSVGRGLVLGAIVAVIIAALAAYLLSKRLTNPLLRLEDGVRQLGSGDLAHRVSVDGPAEIASLGEEFNRMADALEQQEELRRRMVADVAHELRNPIAAARAQAEGMAEGVLETTPERVESLVADLAHLGRLVADLQELATADAGRLSYDFSEMDLGALARREVERARASVPAGVELLVAEQGGAVVSADELRISQVLRNLLANALRHTREGSVTVRVTVGPGVAEVRVDDTGEGIPEQDLGHVFDRFYRADSARATDTGGAGLGLAIARRIISDHGGDVFAENRAGGGASVGFRIPLAKR